MTSRNFQPEIASIVNIFSRVDTLCIYVKQRNYTDGPHKIQSKPVNETEGSANYVCKLSKNLPLAFLEQPCLLLCLLFYWQHSCDNSLIFLWLLF